MFRILTISILLAFFSFPTTVFAFGNKHSFKSFIGSSDNYYQHNNRTTRHYRGGTRRSGLIVTPRRISFPKIRQATGHRVFIYDPRKRAWAAYDAEGKLVKAGPGSGGANYCPDIRSACRTPAGTFSVYRKHGPGYKSKQFPRPRGGAPMPYAMFFKGGYAIHGSYHVPNYNASHGCIRVTPRHAKWLSQNFIQHGTKVIVRSYSL